MCRSCTNKHCRYASHFFYCPYNDRVTEHLDDLRTVKDVSHTCEITDLLDREYEGLDNYSRSPEYEAIQASALSAKQYSIGDFEIINKCPAYEVVWN